MCVCVLVAQSCLTLCDPVADCSLPGSSVQGILQARILGWAAISFSREFFQPRDRTHIFGVSSISRQILYQCATWEALIMIMLMQKKKKKQHSLTLESNALFVGQTFVLNSRKKVKSLYLTLGLEETASKEVREEPGYTEALATKTR